MAIEVSLLKFVFSFRTVKAFTLLATYLAVSLLFFGILTFTGWWHECLYEQMCFEKEFLRGGLSQAVSLTPELVKAFAQDIFTNTIITLSIVLALHFIGIKLNVDKSLLTRRLDSLKHVLPWLKSKYFLPIFTSSYILVFLIFSFFALEKEHKWKKEIAESVEDDLGIFENRNEAKALQARSDYFYYNPGQELSSYTSKVIYLMPELRETIYDTKKYFRFKSDSFDLKKEMSDIEILNLFLKKENELKHIFYLNRKLHKPGGYSEYQINSAIDTLRKFKLKGDINSIIKQMESIKQAKISDDVATYSGEAYLILAGRIVNGKFVNKSQNIDIEIVSPLLTDLKSELAAYLMKVKSYTKTRNGLNAKCEVLAQWDY